MLLRIRAKNRESSETRDTPKLEILQVQSKTSNKTAYMA
jgi:hypothetical protein